MNPGSLTQHLTDEQFADLLVGEAPDTATQAHLAACAHCRGEIEVVRSSIGDFNSFTISWAQRHAHRVPVPSRLALHLGARPAWGLGLAGTVAACLLTVALTRPFQHPEPAPAPQASVSAPSNEELAQDNRLLENINQELRYQVQPAVPASELRSSAQHAERPSGTMVTN